MGLFDTSVQGPLGLSVGEPKYVYAYMRGGTGSQGEVVEFDITAARSDHVTASTLVDGGETRPLSNVISTTETGADTALWHLFGVLADDVADDGKVKVYVQGRVKALAGDSHTIGQALILTTSGELITATDNTYAVAMALETGTNGSLSWVLFDGLSWRYVEDAA